MKKILYVFLIYILVSQSFPVQKKMAHLVLRHRFGLNKLRLLPMTMVQE